MGYIALFFSSVGFLGFVPSWVSGNRSRAGGTMGSLAGLTILCLLLQDKCGLAAVVLGVIISFLLGIITIPPAEKLMLDKWGPRKRHNGLLSSEDFNETCIDEVLGSLIAGLPIFFWPMPLASTAEKIFFLILAVFLFRVFDITKPWLVKAAEEKFDGSLGIMLDDAVAGIFAMTCIILILAARLEIMS